MPEHMTAKGNWLLRILVVILTVFLISSILYPKKLWNEQDKLIELSQERMENLNFVVQRYKKVNDRYSANMDTLMSFFRQDSIQVDRPLFEFERLSLYDAENDCMLVGFIDRFHYDSIAVTQMQPDSVVLELIPKNEFSNILEPVRTTLSGDRNIDYYFRGKGQDDIYYIIYSTGKINREEIPYESKMVPSDQYLLYRPLDEITTDPISGDKFKLNLNVKMELSGKVEYKVLQDQEPEFPVLESELMTNLFINRLARKARSKLEAEMKKDTTLYENQLQYQDDFFEFELEPLEFSKRPVNLEDSKEIFTAIDSVDYFSDPEIIKLELYHVVYDSLIKAWTKWDKTQNILAKMNVGEEYSVTKIDTIGVSIKPPFDTNYTLEADNVLGRIFSVGPIDHPGTITNNDLSWSEKK